MSKEVRIKRSTLWMGSGALGLLMFLAWACTYTLLPVEAGVILRFGKAVRIKGPGRHFRLPFGIEKVVRVPVGLARVLKFGEGAEGRMISGDGRVVEVAWLLQFQIVDPARFIFNLADVDESVRMIGSAAMRDAVAGQSFMNVLTVGRGPIVASVKASLQRVLDQYGSGVRILGVQITRADPPGPVRGAFEEIARARKEISKKKAAP